MNAKILSLNIGHPAPMEWNGKSINSSMLKLPVAGPLEVHIDRIEGNSFASPEFHGTRDFLLYAYGMPSLLSFVNKLGLDKCNPGEVGETLTLDDFDETKVSVGDTFQIGEVLAQACFPRVPCGKVNYRMKNERGQKAMQDCGRSGVYMRILKPGKISSSDQVRLVTKSSENFSIFEVYQMVLKPDDITPEQLRRARANGAFPEKYLARWEK